MTSIILYFFSIILYFKLPNSKLFNENRPYCMYKDNTKCRIQLYHDKLYMLRLYLVIVFVFADVQQGRRGRRLCWPVLKEVLALRRQKFKMAAAPPSHIFILSLSSSCAPSW